MTLKERKFILNYDIGKNLIISSGRQTTTSVNTGDFGATSAYNGYNLGADSYRQSIIPLSISTLTGTLGTLGTMALNFTTQASAASANVASAMSKGLVDSAGNFTQLGAEAAVKAGMLSAGSGLSAGAAGTEAALLGSGSSVLSAGLSAAGYAAGALGTAQGLYSMISGALNYRNRVHDTDMLAGASTSTQSKFGRTYKQIGGFDENGILNMTDALNKADTTNMTMSGLSTGLSAGATIGSAIPGLGTVAGGIIGGLGGLLGGLFWGKSKERERRRLVEQDISNTKEAIEGANLQEESAAGSAGLRDMYNASRGNSTTGILRADNGKNVGSIKEGDYGKIETERGTEYGPIQGMAQPREGIVNYDVPYTHYLGSTDPNVKEPRVDNIPVGSNFDFGKDFILGNRPYEGKKGYPTYADLGRNALKQNETINLKREAGTATPEDEQIYMKNWKYLRSLGDSLMRSTNNSSLLADKGKNVQKYSLGGWLKNAGSNVGSYLRLNGRDFSPLVGLAARLPYAVAESRAADSEVPYAQNSYVDANVTPELNTLASMRVDPSNELRQLTRAAAQNRFNINQAGSLSGGQRVALTNLSNNDLFANRGRILADYAKTNLGFKQAWAQAGILAKQSAAQRAQQALATQQEQYRLAVGAKQKWQELARKNYYTIGGQTLQDWSTNNYQNKMLDLWNKQADTDRLSIESERKNNEAGYNTVVKPNGKVQMPNYTLAPLTIQNPLGWRSVLYNKSNNVNPYDLFDYRNRVSLGGN